MNNIITFHVGNTVLYLTDEEEEQFRNELQTSTHTAEIMGSTDINMQNLLTMPVEAAESFLENKETVNWKRDGF